MTVDENMVKRATACILRVSKPERIILFGSAATGTMNRDSDLDFLVIEAGDTGRRDRILELRAALAELDMPVDVFTMTPDRFEESKEVIGGLAFPAHKYGRVIYEAP